ncbi:MAG TPA: peptidoglycan DD-metalloendopeptidase family protein [Methylomirabilota bacterium]|nr:peptidoglycan DD-metalloendopeptidase family protein [Methylomirabilota bacterium]
MRRPQIDLKILRAAAAGALFAVSSADASVAETRVPAPTGAAGDAAVIEAERTLKGAELEAVRRELDLTTERQAEIAAEIAALEKDRASLNAALLETAARVQDLEASLTETEGRLSQLSEEEAAIRASLDSRREVLADVLAAAQRIGRRPPPALIVRPEDALGAVRSAIVLGAVLPEIRVEAEALAADLAALVEVRSRAETERDRLRADAVSIKEEETRLALLVEEKRKAGTTQAQMLAQERARAEELAGKARTLEELMTSLDRELAAAQAERKAAAEAARLARPAPNDTGRLQPAIAFASTKGLLSHPIRGVTLRDFGEDDGFGTPSPGLAIASRAGARVTAPADGWVVYAGRFRSYGQLLILDVGDGYHILLAGMDKIDVEHRQFVLAGEPVGTMGSQRLASAAVPDVTLSQPVLYIEFRKDGASIDPGPWWVGSQDRKVRG